MAGEFDVFFNEAYYHNRTLGPILSLTFILLMNLIAFSIIIAMVEDAYEIAKARGKTKKGLDPLLIQLILGLRSIRNVLEGLPCLPCIRKKFKESSPDGQTIRRGLKRQTTVLDMINGSTNISKMHWTDLVYQEIINPYGSHKSVVAKGDVILKDILEQDDNLQKARMLLIEKTVLEILMRMSNTLEDSDEVTTLEDITQVHFANLQHKKKDEEKTKQLKRRASQAGNFAKDLQRELSSELLEQSPHFDIGGSTKSSMYAFPSK